MSRTLIKMLPLVALAAVLAGCGAGSKSAHKGAGAMSQGAMGTTAPPAGTVIATVNGQPITSRELDAYVALRTHGMKIHLTGEQRYQVAQQLVQLMTVVQAAEKQGLENQPDIQAGLALERKLYLANKMMEHYVKTMQVPDSVLKSEYATMAKAQSGEEYKARHILVKTKKEAEKIINELNHGADFATLAKKDSTDTSTAKQGGELGWFKPQQMVPPFSAALEKLKPGQYTKQPVKTQYGWHVILLEKERTAAPPSYTASKARLENEAKSSMVRDYLDKLQKEADVHMMIPNPASAVKPAPAASGTPSAPAPKPATH